MFKPKIKVIVSSIFSVLLVLLIIFVSILRANYVAPILMYHSVTPDPDPKNRLAVSTGTFQRQMHFLKKNRYNVLSLGALADLIRDKKKIPHHTVAITLDDGYKDNYTYAFPILKKYSLPATLFVIVNEIGRPDRLSWDEVKEMQDSGIIIVGSHCLGPQPLVNINSEERLKKEIFDSKKILEERLQRKITMFSYPEGRFNVRIKQLVIDAGYKLAVATNPGKKFANNDYFALKRLRISENAGNMFVFWAESSGYYNFMREHRHK